MRINWSFSTLSANWMTSIIFGLPYNTITTEFFLVNSNKNGAAIRGIPEKDFKQYSTPKNAA
jgi:hypothetical protein